MTNSNDALRAALGDKTAVDKIAILSNQDWALAMVDMAATLDMIHEIAVSAIYPASPVAGGDLREAAAKVAEGNVMSGNDQWSAGHDAAARKIAHAIRSLPLS